MKGFLRAVTDWVSTKKGMWITLSAWLAVTVLFTIFGPNHKDYEVSNIASLPDDAQSVIAESKQNQYFEGENGIPAILVFHRDSGDLSTEELVSAFQAIENEKIDGIKELIPLAALPPAAVESFVSEDQTTASLPLIYQDSMETKEIQDANHQISDIIAEETDLELFITGPAGISSDSVDLFSRADLVLLFSTVGLILILLIVIYRSPLLALIPLLAAGFVYQVVMKSLGFLGASGLDLSQQTISIMSILLFAAVIDYSLFVFSRYREELKTYEDRFDSMKSAMRETGLPVFFSGGTVLAAMLVLFFAQSGDYRNFAPTFGTAMVIIMLASVTLVPALFTLFGRKAFWPKVPKVGDEQLNKNSFWSKVARIVVKKPGMAVAVIAVFLVVSSLNLFNLHYEFDTIKSFPEDMPSRQGYELLSEKFAKGDIAPATVLYEAEEAVTPDDAENLRAALEDQSLVRSVSISETTEDSQVISYSVTYDENPYSEEVIDAMEQTIEESDNIIETTNLEGNLYFAGETASLVDDRNVNNRDIIVIVALETILIFVMLIFLTRSIKMPIYMIGTILVSLLSALGLGLFLSDLFFDISTISNRVPLYAFVFLVALGIDYNIILVSRFQEERKKYPVKKAIELAVSNTGGVISSAGIILAATFAVLMTQPIQLLFVFGFIVAVGILLDTFLIRGVLLPGLIVMLEKDEHAEKEKQE
ncbi:MMPL family transporter [Bacillus mesophilum]|uniref:MMPL family transporter n=1 Tax=Bacillus mesophilum TaxID=1071718 RepID=A0A7V7RLU3_9BACI|nr:MMPL family transporter [Bacillus mesophilum]KAB2332839.1 MMPL family transporter [Bacillus mesophilum]